MPSKKKTTTTKKPAKIFIGRAQLRVAKPASGVGVIAPLDLSTDDVLDERGGRYGKFSHHAIITQLLKSIIRGDDINLEEYAQVQEQLRRKYQSMPANMREAMDMTMHKYGRVLNGDHNYRDSWTDVTGYNSLVDKKLAGVDI